MAASTFRWTNAQAACRLHCRSGITEKPSAPRRPPRLTKIQRISRPTQTAQKIAFFSARSLPASLKARATSAPSPSRCGRRSQGILGKLTLRAEDSRPEHSGPELRLATFGIRGRSFSTHLLLRAKPVFMCFALRASLLAVKAVGKRRNRCFFIGMHCDRRTG